MNKQILSLIQGVLALSILASCTAEAPSTVPPTPAAVSMATQAPAPTLRPPTPLPRVMGHSYPQSQGLIPSIDRQIFSADVIVLASFTAATAGTETIPGAAGEASTYRPTVTMNFRATEYLKGSGPTTFSVELRAVGNEEFYENGQRYNGYLTQAKALEAAQAIVAARNTAYDDRPGVLFLKGPVTAASDGGSTGASGASGSTGNYNFALFNTAAQGSFAVDVDSMSRAWLPAQSATTGGESGGASGDSDETTTNPTLITNRSPPSEPPGVAASTDPNTMTLTALKTRVGEIAAMIAAGDGTAAYSDCVFQKLTRHEYFRGRPSTVPAKEHTIASGQAAGTEIYRRNSAGGANYNVHTTGGASATHFAYNIVDGDTDALNGYELSYAITRPLPAGKYIVNWHTQTWRAIPCNFNPTHNNYHTYNVTVTAPANTLHEAFFDPVTIGTAVGADATNGVLKPASFTVGEIATRITGLKWENNQAVLTLNPHASLANHALDFIELDGAVSLTLTAKDATVDSTAGTHTWSVTTQPWHEGDKLMLRMWDVRRPPAFGSDTYSFTVAENTSSLTVIGTALATDPNEGDEVLHTIESGNEGGKFNIDGWAGFIVVWGTLDYETRNSYTLTVKADDGNGGTDTATVNITITDVAE